MTSLPPKRREVLALLKAGEVTHLELLDRAIVALADKDVDLYARLISASSYVKSEEWERAMQIISEQHHQGMKKPS